MFSASWTYWRKLTQRMVSALATRGSARWQHHLRRPKRRRPHWSRSGFRRLRLEQCELRTMLCVNLSGPGQVANFHVGTVNFSETSTDVTVTSWDVNWNDGGSTDSLGASATGDSRFFWALGTYTVDVTANYLDAGGNPGSETAFIDVDVVPPGPSNVAVTSDRGPYGSYVQGDTVTVSTTYDSDPSNVGGYTYAWTVTDRNGATVDTGDGSSVNFTADQWGPYDATCTVTDSYGQSASGTISINVAELKTYTVNVLATVPYAVVGPGTYDFRDGQFMFSRGEGNTSGVLVVHYHFNDDYSDAVPASGVYYGLDQTVTIPDGQSEVPFWPASSSDLWDRTVELVVDSAPTPSSSDSSMDAGGPDNLAGEEDQPLHTLVDTYTLGSKTTDRVTIINQTGVSSPTTQNTDTESTGQSPETVGSGPIVVGVQQGNVSVDWPAGAEQPTYIGNGGLHPMITVQMSLPDGFDDSQPLSAVLTMGRGTDGALISSAPVTFEPAQLTAGAPLQFVLQADASQLPTGHYDYDVVFTGTADVQIQTLGLDHGYTTTTTTTSSRTVTRTVMGSTEIQNRVLDNPLGPGFSMTDVDRLIPGDDSTARFAGQMIPANLNNGLDLARGDGTSAWFQNEISLDGNDRFWGPPSDASYSGDWHNSSSNGYAPFGSDYEYPYSYGDYKYANAGGTATWTKTGLTPNAMYQVFAAWVPGPDRGMADYTVTGATPVGLTPSDGVVAVNQRFGGFISLGFFATDSSGQLEITLSQADSDAGVLIAGNVLVNQVTFQRFISAYDFNNLWPTDVPVGNLGWHDVSSSVPHGTFLTSYTANGVVYDPNSSDPAEFDFTSKFGIQYLFDAAGFLTATLDRNKNATVYTYSTLGDSPRLLEQVQDQDGETWNFAYSGNKLSTITDSGNRVTNYAISDDEVTISQPAPTSGADRPVFNFTLNDCGELTAFEDANHNTTDLAYDDFHRFQKATNPDGSSWTLVSVDSTELASTSPRTVYTTTSDPPQAIYKDENGNPWKYTTDIYGYVTSKTNPANNTWKYIRDPIHTYGTNAWSDGLLTSMVQPAGGGGYRGAAADTPLGELTTTYSYYDSSVGDLNEIDYPDADHSKQFMGYGSYNQLVSSNDFNLAGGLINNVYGPKSYLDANGNADTITQIRGWDNQGYPLYVSTHYTYTPAPTSLGDLAGGLVTSIIDGDGNETDLTYYTSGPSKGLLETKTVAVGTADADEIDYTYDANRNLQSQIDVTMATLTGKPYETDFVYDNLDRLVEEDDPDPAVTGEVRPHTVYKYDADGNQTFVYAPNPTTGLAVDGSGNPVGSVTQFVINNRNWLAAEIDPVPSTNGGADGQPTTAPETDYTYDGVGNKKTTKDPLGRIIQYGYNFWNEQTSFTLPNPATGSTTSGTLTSTSNYDVLGELASTTDARGNTTYFTYDEDGNLIREIDPGTSQHAAPVTSWQYDAANQLVKTIAPSNRETDYVYNGLGLQTTVTVDPAGINAITRTFFDAAGNIVETLDADGNETDYLPDHQNRTTQVTRVGATNETTTTDFDPAGDALSTTDALNNTVYFTLDGLGRTLTESDPEGESTTLRYDALGELLSSKDQLNNTVYYAYDNSGDKIAQTDANAKTTNFNFDLDGEMTGFSDPLGNVTSYAFNFWGQQSGETVMVGTTANTSGDVYDEDGNLIQATDAVGRKTTYTYDQDNQLIKEVWLDSDNSTLACFTYTFDTSGERTSAVEVQDGVTISNYTYSYDMLGRLSSVDMLNLGMPEVILTYGYDLDNNRTSTTATVGGVADYSNTYTYDTFNQLADITQTGQTGGNTVAPKQVALTYDDDGRLYTIARYADASSSPTNVAATATYGYDAGSRLTSLAYAIPDDGTKNINYAWSFDTADRITSTAYSSDYNSAFSNTANYAYDAASQLDTVTNTNDQPGESYQYDANGNRIIAGTSSAPSGTANQIQTDGTYNYTYDADGNRISRNRITPIDGAADNITLYAWDYRNRLTSVTYKSDADTVAKTVTYLYNADNQRISETIDTAVPGSDDSVEVDGTVYDGDNMALDFVAYSLTATPALSHRYLFGDAVDQIFAQENIDPATGDSTEVLWQLTDNQGSVRDIVTGSTTPEVQQITFAGVPAGGTYTITTIAGTTSELSFDADLGTIQAALDALTPHANDIVVSGDYATGFTLTYSGPDYLGTDVVQATIDDSSLTKAPANAPTVVEATAGQEAASEQWQFDVNNPIGYLVILGNGSAVGFVCDGSLDGASLQSDLQTLYGAGDVSVSPSGTVSAGSFTITFTGALADMPISDPPSVSTSGLASGSAGFSQINWGFAGVQELQVITLPVGFTAGLWSVDSQTLHVDADAATVQTAIETATGLSVAVSGSPGYFVVAWNVVGPQPLLTIGTALQYPIVSETTFGADPSGGIQEVQSITLISGAWVDGYDHDLGSMVDGYDHDNGYSTAGYTHDAGNWTDGYDHDNGYWTDGYTHDNGYWTDGYDHDGTWDAAESPDPSWTDPVFDPQWTATGGTTWDAATFPDPSWVTPVYQRQWTATGGTAWDAAETPDADWVNPVFDQQWISYGYTVWDGGETPDPSWVNPLYDPQWTSMGGTVWDAGSSPDPSWVNAMYDAHWVTTGTTWDAAGAPDSTWVNPAYDPHWIANSGTWYLNGISLGLDATAGDVQSVLGSSVTVTGGDGSFTVTWNDIGPQSLLSIDTSGLLFGGGVSETTAGASPSNPGTQEVQWVMFPSTATAGTWTLDGIEFAYDADPSIVQSLLNSEAGLNVDVWGAPGNYDVVWRDVGPHGLLSADTSGLTLSSTIAENTAGVAGNDELWTLDFDHPTGTYIMYGNGATVAGSLLGSLSSATLQAQLQALYGAGNVTVTLTSGDETAGVFTVEFIGDLANQPISLSPFFNPNGLDSGGASFSNVVLGCAGVQEAQIITLPSGLIGGKWNLNGGSALAYNATAAAVQTYLDSLLGQTVTVTGDAGGPYTVTWAAVGPQDLLAVANIDLQVPDPTTTSTISEATATNLVAHYSYDSYGNLLSVKDASNNDISNAASLTSVTYAGYRYDWATQTYVMARIYDPKDGDWLGRDPIELKSGQVNPTDYIANDPINGTDPSGLLMRPINPAWRDELIRTATTELQQLLKDRRISQNEFDVRKATVIAALDAKMSFSSRGARNAEYWVEQELPNGRKGEYIVRNDRSAVDAINDIWVTRGYSTGCAKAAELIILRGVLTTLQERDKKNGNEAYQDCFNEVLRNEVPTDVMSVFETSKPKEQGKVYTQEDFKPGDNIWLKNPYFYMMPASRRERYPGEEGANVFYIGGGLFASYNGMIFDEDGLRSNVRASFASIPKPGSSKSDLLFKEINSPKFPGDN